MLSSFNFVFPQWLCFLKNYLPLKVFFNQMSSSMKIIFNQWPSSITGFLPSKVIQSKVSWIKGDLHHRSSSIKVIFHQMWSLPSKKAFHQRFPSEVIFPQRSSSIKGHLPLKLRRKGGGIVSSLIAKTACIYYFFYNPRGSRWSLPQPS